MKTAIFGTLVALAISASVASAATVTFTVKVDDAAVGGAGKYGLYLTTSAGDNFGDASFQVSLKSGVTPATSAGVTAFSPKAIYQDSNVVLGDLNAGYTLLRSASGTLKVAASQDTIGFGGGSATLIYGMGQSASTFAAHTPAGYDTISLPIQTSWGAPMLIAKGTYTGAAPHATVNDWFAQPTTSVDFANVFTTNSSEAVVGSTIQYAVIGGAPSPVNEFVVGNGANGESVVTAINMTQSPNHLHPNFTPEITPVNSGKGLITITNLDTAADRNELLVWSSLTLAQLQAINPAFAAVEAKWSGFGATAELALPTGLSTYTVAYDLTNGATTGTLTGVAVVPEPASLGLLALGALGLLGKRRAK